MNRHRQIMRLLCCVWLMGFSVKHAQAEPLAVLTPKAIKLKHKIRFAWGNNRLRKGAYPLLAKIGEILRKYPQLRISIEGHSDSRGSSRFNKILTHRRACRVRQYLIAQEGISASRLVCVGYGESRPIMPNITRRNRRLNQRIEFIILKKKKARSVVPSLQKRGNKLIRILPTKIQPLRPITFSSANARLHKTALPVLDQVAQAMQQNPDWKLSIEGHTDSQQRHGMKLSYLRACAIKKYLVSRGIKKKRMRCAGYGTTKPLTSNQTARGRQLNRRIVLRLQRKEGR